MPLRDCQPSSPWPLIVTVRRPATPVLRGESGTESSGPDTRRGDRPPVETLDRGGLPTAEALDRGGLATAEALDRGGLATTEALGRGGLATAEALARVARLLDGADEGAPVRPAAAARARACALRPASAVGSGAGTTERGELGPSSPPVAPAQRSS